MHFYTSMKFSAFTRFFSLTFLLLLSCKKEKMPAPSNLRELSLEIRHQSLGNPLTYDAPVADSSGCLLRFTRFQYYLSGIRLETDNPADAWIQPSSFHLIKALDNGGKSLVALSGIPERPFKYLVLHIGLDSLVNHAAGGTGALDPGNGMYWSWSGEYKFMVLEGNYQHSDSSGAFLFHIAGDPCYREIRLPLAPENGSPVSLSGKSAIQLDAEIAALFAWPNRLDLRAFNNVMSLESGAGLMAENYSGRFFRVSGLKN